MVKAAAKAKQEKAKLVGPKAPKANAKEGKAEKAEKATGLALVHEGPGPLGADAANAVGYQLRKLAKQGNPQPLQDWKKLDHVGKKSMALKIKMDPACSFITASDSNRVGNLRGRLNDWFALWEVAS